MKEKIQHQATVARKYLTKIPTPTIIFIVIALILGSVYIKNIGTLSGPDMSGAHYRAALAFATGQSFTTPEREGYSKRSRLTGAENYFESGSKCQKNQLATAAISSPLSPDRVNECTRNSDKILSPTKNTAVMGVVQYPRPSILAASRGSENWDDNAYAAS